MRTGQPLNSRLVSLGEIAALRSGFVPSATESRERRRQEEEERLRPAAAGATNGMRHRDFGVQPSALQPDGTIAWNEIVAVLPIRSAERYVIRDGDLLLPLRSQRTQAVVARQVPDGVLAIGPWVLVTPRESTADADYLAWYLNHPLTRARLVGAMVGTSLQFLTVGSVRDFEVHLPDLATQRRIGRVATLTARLSRLERLAGNARQKLADELLMAAANGTGRTGTMRAAERPLSESSDE